MLSKSPLFARFVATALAAIALVISARAHDAAPEMAAATKAFLATLTAEQKAIATIPFADAERVNWHYIPRPRKGIALKALAHDQRLMVHALLATGLSHRGYTKTVNIMSLEKVLGGLENNPDRRNSENYYLTIFGDPGIEPWGWRFEGHHIALNLTFAGGTGSIAASPQFFGANPAETRSGPRTGLRILAAEEDLGRKLVQSLSDTQKRKAIILARAPGEIANVPGRQETKPAGISWADLDAAQRETLLAIVREFAGRFRPEIADDEMKRLENAGLDKLHFAWAGPTEPKAPHYYRVQSASFALEYDNVQNGANHIHTAWRDFDRDFGTDLLGEHHKTAHTK